ncbi:MAG: carboxymuconolactone decarboxylase family protein [Gemmatimonadaceae bacterium]
MQSLAALTPNVPGLDSQTRNLVRIAAAIAGSREAEIRTVMEQAVGCVDAGHVDEVLLQSCLFAGFPRALNAARIWRTVSGEPAPASETHAPALDSTQLVEQGTKTCARVYGESYVVLRENIRALHPALDAWMIADGYGKVLSRPYLDLKLRELCIVAACAASMQQRQLHSHLHGALNCGATPGEVAGVFDSLEGLVGSSDIERYRTLLSHALSGRQPNPLTTTQ